MRVSGTAIVGIACALVPVAATACSCRPQHGDLTSVLMSARNQSVAIYLGTVEAISAESRVAVVRVDEPLKGAVTAGERFQVRVGDSGACHPLLGTGERYLFYAETTATDISLCSRTRPASPDDAEVVWLRTGKLPPSPRLMRRAVLRCQQCRIQQLANALVGSRAINDWPEQSEPRIKTLLRGEEPFWVHTCGGDRRPCRVLGRATDGPAFELAITADPDDTACQIVVTQRSCSRLDRKAWEYSPGLDCTGPSASATVCDERNGRQTFWGLLEEVPTEGCLWDTARTARCRLAPISRGVATAKRSGPVLRCVPPRSSVDGYSCVVSSESAPP